MMRTPAVGRRVGAGDDIVALTTCRECGGQLSTNTDACPKCGAKTPRLGCGGMMLVATLGLVALGAVGSIVGNFTRQEQRAREAQQETARRNEDAARRATMTPKQRAAKDKEDAEAAARRAAMEQQERQEYAKLLALARAIKQNANDPESVRIEEALYTLKGAMMIKYRGRNGFGGLVLNYVVVAPNGKMASGSMKDVAKLWNKHIADQGYDDYTQRVKMDL
jgi:hypothetical protein